MYFTSIIFLPIQNHRQNCLIPREENIRKPCAFSTMYVLSRRWREREGDARKDNKWQGKK